ncbi:hypothetical protein LTS18_002019, partial [Coniosporium uncinatum]
MSGQSSGEGGRETPSLTLTKSPDPGDGLPADTMRPIERNNDRLRKTVSRQDAPPSPPDLRKLSLQESSNGHGSTRAGSDTSLADSSASAAMRKDDFFNRTRRQPPPPPPHGKKSEQTDSANARSPLRLPKTEALSYRKEYPATQFNEKQQLGLSVNTPGANQSSSRSPVPQQSGVRRKAVNSAPLRAHRSAELGRLPNSDSSDDTPNSTTDTEPEQRRRKKPGKEKELAADIPSSPMSDTSEHSTTSPEDRAWKERVDKLLKKLPNGVDEAAAKQILNEIVIHGDEVHWSDVA